ncbi:MAG: epimerase [Deltaproteobacteria bacterium]|jgi:nucleoside-diphosphate-sugar epimerase|nr:epimerase [Deltaproteobacteria bacterium]
MRVMLTGATGLTGFHTAVALMRAGHEPRCLVRSEEKLRRAFAEMPVPDFVVGDMTDPASVEKALTGCEAAVHAAGLVTIEARRGDEVMETNLRGTDLVVGGAIERGLRHVVYVSSLGAIFDPWGGKTRGDGPIVPASNPYSLSKARCEERVRALQDGGAPISIVYPSAIQGPDDPGLSEANQGMATLLKTVVPVTSGGYVVVDARDLAQALVALLDAGSVGRFIAAGHFLTWREQCDLLGELTGRSPRTLPLPGWLYRLLGRAGDLLRHAVSFDFPMTLEAMTFMTRFRPIASSPELSELGVGWRPTRGTYEDTLRWLLREGHLDPQLAPRLADPASG